MQHKILIVDDETEVRNIVKLQLSGTRYEILEAEDGERAVELLNEHALFVELIICDVRMPKMNGIDAVAYFRREFHYTPVIVLTGYPDVKLAVDFMQEGVSEYLVKPVEKRRLLMAVDKAIAERPLFSDSLAAM